MSVITRIVLALVVLLIGVMALYYGYLLPADGGSVMTAGGSTPGATEGQSDEMPTLRPASSPDQATAARRASVDQPPSLRSSASGLTPPARPERRALGSPSSSPSSATANPSERRALSAGTGSGSDLRGPAAAARRSLASASQPEIEMGGTRHGDAAASPDVPEKSGDSNRGAGFRAAVREQLGQRTAGAAATPERTMRSRLGTPASASRSTVTGRDGSAGTASAPNAPATASGAAAPSSSSSASPASRSTTRPANRTANQTTNQAAAARPAGGQPAAARAAADPSGTWTIRSGDTLSGIAADWFGAGHHWRLIAAANPDLNPSNLVIGQVVTLPPKSAARPAAKPLDDSITRVNRATLKAGERVHVVGSGDTLTSIALRYYDDANAWEAIAEANRRLLGDNADRLDVGMELRIPRQP
ncbi:MAG: LysM peptidoglycan-binding domain-containing protein [Phycisphaerales bacterium]